MDALTFFDAEKYFSEMCKANKFARNHDFHFCTCSGIESLEGPLMEFSTKNAFFCLDDTNGGGYSTGRSGGWHEKRVFTVFLMHRYTFGDEEERLEMLGICRELLRQLLSKIIADEGDPSNEYAYFDTRTIMTRKLGKYFMNGCTGCYFMLEMNEPVDLVYNPDEWLN